MTDLHLYRIWCETESSWVEGWYEEDPNVCPNNNGHTITSSKTTVVDTLACNEVTADIKENALTGGKFFKKGWKFSIPNTVGEHVNVMALPFAIDALATRAELSDTAIGDHISVKLAPDAIVGAVDDTNNYAIGAKVITVDQSVVDNMDEGYTVKFGDDTNIYWVTAVDTTNRTITIWPKDGDDNGLTAAINDNAYVKRTIYMTDKEYFSTLLPIITGDSKIGGSGIPASTTVQVIVHNTETVAKTLVFNVAALYGKLT